MNAAELAVRRERVLGVGTELFYDKPVHLVRDEELKLHDADGRWNLDPTTTRPARGTVTRASGSHDATRKVRPSVVFGCDHTDAFVAAFEETVREFY